MDEVFGSLFRIHARVHEADQVRERVVAKYHMHLRSFVLVTVDVVEFVRRIRAQHAFALPVKIGADGTPQHAFIGGHPADAQLVRDANRFI